MTRKTRARRLVAALVLAKGICIALPAPGAAQEANCERSISGQVHDVVSGFALPGVQVVIVWERDPEAPPLFPVRIAADAEGSFAACPPASAIGATVWAELGDDSSPSVEIDWAGDRRADLSLTLEGEDAGRMVGRVTDARTGRPIPAVSITSRGTLLATTNQRGDFIATGLVPGSYSLRIEHLGYEPVEEQVDVASGFTQQIDIGLTADPIELEPLVVQTRRLRRLEYQGFYERKRWGEALGLGSFVTLDDIERRRPQRMTHMLGDLPGLRVRCRGTECIVSSIRSSECLQPTFYLDGTKLRGRPVNIDEYVLPFEVAGVEAYAGPSQIPAEFGGTDAQCGAVVIWTK